MTKRKKSKKMKVEMYRFLKRVDFVPTNVHWLPDMEVPADSVPKDLAINWLLKKKAIEQFTEEIVEEEVESIVDSLPEPLPKEQVRIDEPMVILDTEVESLTDTETSSDELCYLIREEVESDG